MSLAADLQPDLRIRRRVEIGECAVARLDAPRPDALKFILLARGEELAAMGHGAFQPPGAEIILAALQQHRLERLRQQLLHDGNVLVKELLLEIDRVGRDERLAVFRLRVQDGRDQVREAFADARAGLDDEMSAVLGTRLRNGRAHRLLLRAVLEVLGARQHPAGPERLGNLPLQIGGKIVDGSDHGVQQVYRRFDRRRGGG